MVLAFIIPLLTIGLAELGDKSQLCIFLISAKTTKHMKLFLGIMLAFLVVDGFAVILGSWISRLIPMGVLGVVSGFVFLFVGALLLLEKRMEDKCRVYLGNPFASGFALIFLSEWGDKTQIASGLFATQYNPLFVLAGVMLALTILSLMAIFLGRFVSQRINKNLLGKIAGITFMMVGLSFLVF